MAGLMSAYTLQFLGLGDREALEGLGNRSSHGGTKGVDEIVGVGYVEYSVDPVMLFDELQAK